jgi:hypothetical protein
MKKLEYSQFGRQKCGHTIIALNGPGGSGWGACFDDAYNMNPRGSLFLLLFSIIGSSRSILPEPVPLNTSEKSKHTSASLD